MKSHLSEGEKAASLPFPCFCSREFTVDKPAIGRIENLMGDVSPNLSQAVCMEADRS
jgi:hypothetical protein